ncbi:helix-turn-helix transcriptional regulator [Paenibacillus oryzisoli]|uniref:helix-turn-helix domain-containing protein n=1 Tax=Paenibacillus oryzisoli TaxID=1850517 RepID=UPI003D27232E
MDYDFFNSFSPKILDVVERDLSFWQTWGYQLLRERTRMHIFALVVAGEGTITVGNGERQPLREGTLFQVWPGNRMDIVTSPEKTLCFYSVHYQYGRLQWDGIKADWQGAEGPLPIDHVLPGLGTRDLEERFERLLRCWIQKEAGFEWETRVDFLGLVQAAVAAAAGRRGAEEAGAAAIVREAIAYMKTNFREELTREMMAGHASLSPAYFSSLFKKHTGYSPIQYLTRIRIDHAKQLLRESSLPIRQVAEESGIPDSFYFTRIFSRETGLTPSHYRQG